MGSGKKWEVEKFEATLDSRNITVMELTTVNCFGIIFGCLSTSTQTPVVLEATYTHLHA
jgi:hypothetical protein